MSESLSHSFSQFIQTSWFIQERNKCVFIKESLNHSFNQFVWNSLLCVAVRVGYRNPVPIWHQYLCNRYVLEPNQNADFGASFRCHAWAIGWNICHLFLRNGRKKHHHRHLGEKYMNVKNTAREKLFPDWEIAHELNSESSNNTSPTNLCSNPSVRFSHSDLKAQRGMRARECSNYTCSDGLPLTSYATTTP